MSVCSPQAGAYAIKALDIAIQAVKQGDADMLVTMPINKAAMPQDIFPYKGHTEYLQAQAGIEGEDALMILAQDKWKIVMVML